MKERYSIKISDIQLTILSDEPEDFVHTTVAQLDERICTLTVQNKRCSKLDAALLCALDSLSEKLKGEKKIRNLEAQISLYEATNKRLREELEAARAGIALSQESVDTVPVNTESVEDEPMPALVEESTTAAPVEESAPAAPIEESAPAAPIEESAPAAPIEEDPEKEEDAPAETTEEETASSEDPEVPAVEATVSPLHDDKLRQIEDLLRRRSEEHITRSSEASEADKTDSHEPRTAATVRDEKLRQIEDLLRKNGSSKTLSEALHNAIGN